MKEKERKKERSGRAYSIVGCFLTFYGLVDFF